MHPSRILSALTPSLIVSTLATVALTANLIPAQAGAGILRGATPNAAFTGVGSWGIHCYEFASNKSGEYTCALTSGSPAGVGVTIGHYDPTNGTFNPTQEADALNSTGWNTNLTLEPGHGRYAVFVRGDQNGPLSVHFASRSTAGTPFGAPVQIAGLSPAPGVYILGYVEGALKLFYPDGPLATSGPDKIVMQDLDVSNLNAPALVGPKEVVAKLTNQGIVMIDASVVNGPTGEVRGLVITEVFIAPNQNPRPRLVFKAGLDPNHPASSLVELPPNCGSGPCAAMRGSFAGGRCLFTGSWQGPPALMEAGAAWILSDRMKIGQTADIFGAVASSQNRAETHVYMSLQEAPAVSIPSVIGSFALDLPITFVGKMSHAGAGQRGHLAVAVPNDQNLRGFRGAIQGLSFDSGTGTYAFTNTARVVIE